MITQEQLDELKNTFFKRSSLWTQAFSEYNQNRPPHKKYPVGFGCRSCWYDVFKWHEKRLMLDNDTITISIK